MMESWSCPPAMEVGTPNDVWSIEEIGGLRAEA